MNIKLTLLLLPLIIVFSCSYNDILPEPIEDKTLQESEIDITYTNHTKKIIDNHCVSCHSSFGQSPPLTNFSEVSSQKSRIQARAIDNNPTPMPPGNPLPQNLKDTLQLWINQGALQ